MDAPLTGEVIDGYRFTGGDPGEQKAWEPAGDTPKPGDIYQGFVFKGGDPGEQKSWEKYQPPSMLQKLYGSKPGASSDATPPFATPEQTMSPMGDVAYSSGQSEPEPSAPTSAQPATESGPEFSAMTDAGLPAESADSGQPGPAVQVGRGMGAGAAKTAEAINLTLSAVPRALDAIASVASTTPSTDFQDWWFGHMVEPLETTQKELGLPPEAGFVDKVAHGFGGLVNTLADVIAATPASEAVPAAQLAELTATKILRAGADQAARAAIIPGLTDAADLAKKVYAETGDALKAANAGAAAYLTTALAFMVPASAEGNLATRAVTGAAGQAASAEAGRRMLNAVLPPNLQVPFSASDLAASATLGAGLGAGLGHRAQEVPQVRTEAAPGEPATAGQIDVTSLPVDQALKQVSEAPITPVALPYELSDADVGLAGGAEVPQVPREAQGNDARAEPQSYDFASSFPPPRFEEQLQAGRESAFAGTPEAEMSEALASTHEVVGTDHIADKATLDAIDQQLADGVNERGKALSEKQRADLEAQRNGLIDSMAGRMAEYENEFGSEARNRFEQHLLERHQALMGDENARPVEGAAGPDSRAGIDTAGTADVGRVAEPAEVAKGAEEPAAGREPPLEDFTGKRGEVKTFANEANAKSFAANAKNAVPKGFAPRQTEDGWVLSRVPRERTAAQLANDARMRKSRTTVEPHDSLATMMGKLGGVKLDELTSDGFDAPDAKYLRSAVFGKPAIRKNGGISLDAMAEALASHGWDVHDEAGRVDQSKLRELIDRAVHEGDQYTPEGHEYHAGREAERRYAEERAKALPDEAAIEASGYHELSEPEKAAVDEIADRGLPADLKEGFTNEEGENSFAQGSAPASDVSRGEPAAAEPLQGVRRGAEASSAEAPGAHETGTAGPDRYAEHAHRTVEQRIALDEGGEAVLTHKADEAMREIDDRISAVEELAKCLA